jgi:ABC-2 type transport system ATP-binding protein
MLEVESLAKRFISRTGPVQAVNGVSFALGRGEVLGFLGPNGAGKTTTIKMVAGLVRPDQGSVRVGGEPVGSPRARARIGAVLEGSRNLYWRLTPLENLVYWGMMRGLGAREARLRGLALLERVGLAEKAANTLQTLSRGMQQKAAVAVALVHRPALLLLDEPTLGLDWQSGQEIQTMVRELRDEGSAILLTTHQLDVAQALSDRVAIMRDGRMVLEGATGAVLEAFSRPVARVTLGRAPERDQAERLRALGAEFDPEVPERLAFGGGGGDPTAALSLLAQVPGLLVESVTRDRASLSHVFERVVGDGAAAVSASADTAPPGSAPALGD